MNIDEKVLQSLIEKEIKMQVEKKLKTIGRQTIIDIYRDSVDSVVRDILAEKSKEATLVFQKELVNNTTDFQEKVSDKIAAKFASSIKNAFLEEESSYDDDVFYDDDF